MVYLNPVSSPMTRSQENEGVGAAELGSRDFKPGCHRCWNPKRKGERFLRGRVNRNTVAPSENLRGALSAEPLSPVFAAFARSANWKGAQGPCTALRLYPAPKRQCFPVVLDFCKAVPSIWVVRADGVPNYEQGGRSSASDL